MSRDLEIAVIDDDQSFRVALVESLSSLGYGAVGYASAEDYIGLIGGKSFDCVVTDIHMPGSMDGLKLAHAVRNRWPPIKIIVTSGRETVAEQDLPAGGRFFAKPYDPSEIKDALRAWAF